MNRESIERAIEAMRQMGVEMVKVENITPAVFAQAQSARHLALECFNDLSVEIAEVDNLKKHVKELENQIENIIYVRNCVGDRSVSDISVLFRTIDDSKRLFPGIAIRARRTVPQE